MPHQVPLPHVSTTAKGTHIDKLDNETELAFSSSVSLVRTPNTQFVPRVLVVQQQAINPKWVVVFLTRHEKNHRLRNCQKMFHHFGKTQT